MVQISKILSSDFSKINLPPKIYKYRDWDNENHKRIISEQEVFFASPDSFDDEFDCKIPVRYDLLNLKDVKNGVKYHNPNWNRHQIHKYSVDWLKNGKKLSMQRQNQAMLESFKNYGILSLTAIPNNESMWVSYGDNHKGFCIGFDTLVLFNYLKSQGCGGGPVCYCSELPIIYPIPKSTFEERHVLLIFSKLVKWEFEKEYRLFKFSENSLCMEDRKVKIPPDAFSEIIIGSEMSSKNADNLLDSIPSELGHVLIKEETEL